MSELKFSQDYVIYRVKCEGVYPIRVSDWTRLKRIINGIIPNKRIFQVISSIFFGMFVSALFTLISFSNAKDLDSWVMPTTWVILLVSFIGGAFLLILDKIQKDMITNSTSDVLNEMIEIENGFEKYEDE